MNLGLQLYTLRDLIQKDARQTLQNVREIGYKTVELAGTCGYSREEYKAILHDCGLTPTSSHSDVHLDGSNVEEVVEEAKFFGCSYVVLAWLGKEHYAGGWTKVGEQLAAIGRKVRAAGLTFCYHNHNFEFELEADGRPGWHALFDAAGDDLMAELDTFWVDYAGFTAAEEIKRLAGRLPILHAKDLDPNDNRHECAPGEGNLDWPAILRNAEAAGVKTVFMEVDNPRRGIDDVESGFRFLTANGLVP